MSKRRLTDEQKARRVEVLARLTLNGGNVSKTSRDMGETRQTIIRWREENREAAEKVEQEKANAPLEQQQKEIAETVDRVISLTENKVEELATKLVDSLITDVDKGQKFYDRAWAFGVVFDKLQILRGKPTVISQNNNTLSEEEKAARVAELMEKARQRRLNGGGKEMALLPTGTGGEVDGNRSSTE